MTGSRRSADRGAILIQFALLSFAFFGIAALVIDMRIASLSQQQMQVATDTTALEGLRHRDEFGVASSRLQARKHMSFAFDDDLDPSNGDPYDYGAGPNTQVVGGRASDGALGRIVIPANRVYDPILQLNLVNLQNGDIVSGDFLEADTLHIEIEDYTRTDFTPAAPTGLDTAESLLVRLRRTADPDGLDAQAGVSSSALPLPFLWGRGSLIKDASGSSYHPKRDGLTIRAASIASLRRALTVATPGEAFGFNGTLPIVIRSALGTTPLVPPGQLLNPGGGPPPVPPAASFPVPGLAPPAAGTQFGDPGFWGYLNSTSTVDLTARADGTIRFDNYTQSVGGSPVTFRGGIWGYFAKVTGTADTQPRVVGEPTFLHTPSALPLGDHFIPVVRDVNGIERVIGLVFIDIIPQPLQPGDGTPTDPADQIVQRFRLGKRPSRVVYTGASAISPDALTYLAASIDLVDAHATFDEPVLAPVLTR